MIFLKTFLASISPGAENRLTLSWQSRKGNESVLLQEVKAATAGQCSSSSARYYLVDPDNSPRLLVPTDSKMGSLKASDYPPHSTFFRTDKGTWQEIDLPAGSASDISALVSTPNPDRPLYAAWVLDGLLAKLKRMHEKHECHGHVSSHAVFLSKEGDVQLHTHDLSKIINALEADNRSEDRSIDWGSCVAPESEESHLRSRRLKPTAGTLSAIQERKAMDLWSAGITAMRLFVPDFGKRWDQHQSELGIEKTLMRFLSWIADARETSTPDRLLNRVMLHIKNSGDPWALAAIEALDDTAKEVIESVFQYLLVEQPELRELRPVWEATQGFIEAMGGRAQVQSNIVSCTQSAQHKLRNAIIHTASSTAKLAKPSPAGARAMPRPFASAAHSTDQKADIKSTDGPKHMGDNQLKPGVNGDISEIVRGLWVGNGRAARDVNFLKNQGITHVINCTPTPSADGWDLSCYLQLDLKDDPLSAGQFATPRTPLTIEVLDRTHTFIGEALKNNGKVLVHCEHGQSRSVAVATAFLCAQDPHLTSRDAQAYIETKRSVAGINKWFQKNLSDYHSEHVSRCVADCDQQERAAAKACSPGAPAYKTAEALGLDIVQRIDGLGDKKASEVYASIGDDDSGFMGAVGKDPETVRSALLEGTLHERVAQAYGFFQWVSASPERRVEVGLSGDGGDLSILPRAFIRAKEAVVDERVNRDASDSVNTDTASKLGIQVSDRQKAFWGEETTRDPVPPFRRARIGTTLTPLHSRPAKYCPPLGEVEFCGPSTHAFYLIKLGHLLGYDLNKMADVAHAFLGSIGSHTRHEVDLAQRMFQNASIPSSFR